MKLPKTKPKTLLGKYLQDCRLEVGLSMLAVAQEAGLASDRSTIWRIEVGINVPSLPTLYKLERIYHLDVYRVLDLATKDEIIRIMAAKQAKLDAKHGQEAG